MLMIGIVWLIFSYRANTEKFGGWRDGSPLPAGAPAGGKKKKK
jgi:hypothetical protein